MFLKLQLKTFTWKFSQQKTILKNCFSLEKFMHNCSCFLQLKTPIVRGLPETNREREIPSVFQPLAEKLLPAGMWPLSTRWHRSRPSTLPPLPLHIFGRTYQSSISKEKPQFLPPPTPIVIFQTVGSLWWWSVPMMTGRPFVVVVVGPLESPVELCVCYKNECIMNSFEIWQKGWRLAPALHFSPSFRF